LGTLPASPTGAALDLLQNLENMETAERIAHAEKVMFDI
jgi:hypothetical protein